MKKKYYVVGLWVSVLLQQAGAMPVEDFVNEKGTWANFAQIIHTVANTANQVATGYQMVAMTKAQMANFNLKNINNMSSAMSAAQSASKLGKSIVYTSSAGINRINDWTANQNDPKGRLNGLTSVMDTAKATLAVAGKQASFAKKEAGDVSNINQRGSAVSGQTQAVMAGNQLMSHLNAQVQSVNTTLNQQNALAATEAAHRAAVAANVTGKESKIAKGLANIGKATYQGEDAPDNPYGQ